MEEEEEDIRERAFHIMVLSRKLWNDFHQATNREGGGVPPI